MLKIGITGGIGSGKTTLCKMFEELGVPVYYADVRAKELMQTDPVLIAAIQQTFGVQTYLENGQLNRPWLAEIVFNNPEKLKALNEIVHPAVFKDNARWNETMELKKVAYTLKEAALLIESGANKRLDQLIVVTADKNTRVHRIQNRDASSSSAVLARINNQTSDAEKKKFATYLIENNGNLLDLKTKVLEIHEKILQRI